MKHLLKVLVLVALFISGVFAERPVKIGGSTTAESVLVQQFGQIDSSAFILTSSSSIQGLKDLKSHNIHIALNAGGDEAFKKAGLQKADYSSEELVKGKVVFFVNKKNPVKTLTYQQVKNLFSGKITRWEDVGGGIDKTVAVIAEAKTGGLRTHLGLEISLTAQIAKKLNIDSYVATAETTERSPYIPTFVANNEDGIGYEFVAEGTKPQWMETVQVITVTDEPDPFSLTAVTTNNPSEDERFIISKLKSKKSQ